MTQLPGAKFELGRVVATPAAAHDFTPEELRACLLRHAQGDWGSLIDADKEQNDAALASGDTRLMSVYEGIGDSGETLWIITEWDRSVTTLLLPSEY